MYTGKNFKKKADLKRAIETGEKIDVYSPGPFPCPTNGTVYLEGPHYPAPHTWYAQAEVKDGYIVKVK